MKELIKEHAKKLSIFPRPFVKLNNILRIKMGQQQQYPL